MNKKSFIKKLKENLNILDDNEVNDIISEYTDIIDEKIKNGEKEEEAIKDFGDISELSKEILKAYKLNPKFTEKGETNIGDDFESLIKKGADKLSGFTKKIVEDAKSNDNELTLEKIFEIVLKSIALLFICAVLRIPFMIITELGEMILNVAFFPIDNILMFFWNIIIWIVYTLVCILIGIAMFKNYFAKNMVNKSVEKVSKKKEPKKEKSIVEELKEEKVIKQTVVRENVIVKGSNSLLSAILLIIKILVTIFITVPLIIINIFIGIAICILIYYLCVGINLIGPIILLIGIAIFFQFLTSIFINVFNNRMRHFIAPIIVSFVFIVFGSFVTLEQARHYQYISDGSHDVLNLKKDEIMVNLDENQNYTIANVYNDKINKIIDENIPNGKLKVQIEYNSDVVEILINNDDKLKNEIYRYKNNDNEVFWKLYNDFIENLKEKRVYSYKYIHSVEISVYGNETTLRQIKNN